MSINENKMNDLFLEYQLSNDASEILELKMEILNLGSKIDISKFENDVLINAINSVNIDSNEYTNDLLKNKDTNVSKKRAFNSIRFFIDLIYNH